MDTGILFFELIQVSIGNRSVLSRIPTRTEWRRLYEMAEKQSLTGVCFIGLQQMGANCYFGYSSIGLPEMLYIEWMGKAAQIQQFNELVNHRCVELQKRLSAAGKRSYIMKGQGNAALYGDLAMLRQAGDIDIFVEGGLESVLAYANSIAPTKKVNELEMHVRVFDDTDVEFHYRPFIMRNPIRNARLQKIFNSFAEANFANKVRLPDSDACITAPVLEFNMVHQMVHIYHHLFTEGIGLRQLMDYYFLLNSGVDPSVAEQTRKQLDDLHLTRFASALMWVLGYVFGLPREKMIWEPDENDGRFLLDEIMQSGNFGKYDERLSHGKVSKWRSFWRVSTRNLRLARFDMTDWFWGPLWRLYHFIWRKIKGFE